MIHRHSLLAASLATALAGFAAPSLAAGNAALRIASPARFESLRTTLDATSREEGNIAVFVTLRGTPASVAYARSLARGGGGVMARAAAGQASRTAAAGNRAAQMQFATALAASGVAYTELYRAARVLNGVALRVKAADMTTLAALPGVEAVRRLPLHTPSAGSSVPFINAPKLWEGTPLNSAGYDGNGIRIGIIDTGIDYQHPMFGGTGLLADYQANDRTTINETGAAAFPTAKVVGGHDFAGDAYDARNDATSTPAPDDDPMDCGGHGSHVAGIAGGFGVRSDGTPFVGPWNTGTDFAGLRIGPGVAPRASLYALRVFGCTGSTALTIDALDWAQDPNGDDDLSDRLDVVNLSLGSPFGQPDDDSAVAADNAAATGMIVVISAGNSGDTYFVSGSPGSSREAITVANTLDDGVGGPVRANAPAALAGIKTSGAASFGPAAPPAGLTADVVAVDDGSTATVPPGAAGGTPKDGCQTPYANAAAVAGKIVFIDRGGCPFKLKVYNAQLNGAAGAIIGNVSASNQASQVTGMADDTTIPAVTIPSVNIALADANAFRANLANAVNATLTNGADTVSASTSRGPTGAPGKVYLKPDLAAPGTSIVSTQTGVVCNFTAPDCQGGNPSGYAAGGRALTLSGTSMAAPHVAGYAALLRQQNPGASTQEIKAVAINSARHGLTAGPGGTLDAYGAGRVGAGRVDAAGAVSPVAAFNDANPELVAVTFDDDVVGSADVTRNVRLQNRTAIPQKVDLSLSPVVDAPGVAFSLPGVVSQVTVPPAGSTRVPVRMVATGSAMKRQHDPTVAATQVGTSPTAAAIGPLPREYIAEESANLVVSKGGQELARVPVYMAHKPHSQLSGRIGSGDDFTIGISGTGLCTGTLDGTSCDGDATDHQSTVSILELQYTGNRNPQLPAQADVQYAGAAYADDLFVFGLSTFGPWATANRRGFDVCVDTDEDGNYDRVLFATSLTGYLALVSQSNPPMDVFVTGMLTQQGSLSIPSQPNFSSPANYDGGLLNGNTLLLSASAADLGLADGDRKVRYAVAVCSSGNALCADITAHPDRCGDDGVLAALPGSYTYDGNAPGVSFPVAGGGPSVFLFEQDGSVLYGSYDAANLAANGASGVLLLHHANLPAEAAQVIHPDRIFADGFE